jgi:hypothetical protein
MRNRFNIFGLHGALQDHRAGSFASFFGITGEILGFFFLTEINASPQLAFRRTL